MSLITAYGSSFIIGKTLPFYNLQSSSKGMTKTSLGVFQGGFFFAKPMRDKNFVTLLDPFHTKYGKVLAGIMALVSVLNDVMWVPVTMTGLGESFSGQHHSSGSCTTQFTTPSSCVS